MKPGTVFACYCHNGMIHEEFMVSILRMLPYDAKRRHLVQAFCGQRGLYLADNRNQLCKVFLKTECEWLWMLDTDIVFEPQLIYQMLDIADPEKRPILSALYFSYVTDLDRLSPVWMERTGNNDHRVIRDFDGGLQKVDAIGMGCCLIHRSVLERFKTAYPEPYVWFGHDPVTLADGTVIGSGEDITFCSRAQKLGYEIWGNGANTVGHIKAHKETIESFVRRYENQYGGEELAAQMANGEVKDE